MAPANGNPSTGTTPGDRIARWAALRGEIAAHDARFAAEHPHWQQQHGSAGGAR